MKYQMIQNSGALQEGVQYKNKIADDFDEEIMPSIISQCSAPPISKGKKKLCMPSLPIHNLQRGMSPVANPAPASNRISHRQESEVFDSRTKVGGGQNHIAGTGATYANQNENVTKAGSIINPAMYRDVMYHFGSAAATPEYAGMVGGLAAPVASTRQLDGLPSQDHGLMYNIKATHQTSNVNLQERKGMFRYTIPEGLRVLVTYKNGQSKIVDGPCRLWRWGKTFRPLQQFTAYPGEFLIVKHRNGSQNHIAGPCQEWLDPRIHTQIEKNDGLQIAVKEAVVAYSKDNTDHIVRRIIHGPALFIPSPGEWLHTFYWHGNKDGSYKKVPGGLVFQKLWLMPDQMYHDVEGVCTADDVTLTIKLMIFFELTDLDRMLEGTHDPIGDFINATSSDVIDFVKRFSFDDFKSNSERLNSLTAYSQLLNRAEQVGYKIHKIVYRGYTTAEALQNMQNHAIETRTKLKLERETEEQTQKLADYKQKCESERDIQIHRQEQEAERCEIEKSKLRRQDAKDQEMWDLEKEKLREQQQMELRQQQYQIEIKQQQQEHQQQLEFLQQLKAMDVELTSYLTQARADQVIELRSAHKKLKPHIHLSSAGLNPNPNPNSDFQESSDDED